MQLDKHFPRNGPASLGGIVHDAAAGANLATDRDRPNVDAIFSRLVVHGRRLHGTDSMRMTCTLLIEDIRPRSRQVRTMTRVTQHGGCRHFLVRTLV